MGWWSDFKSNRELNDARRMLQRARSPFAISVFVDKCLEMKKVDLAYEESQQGLAEFPDSEALKEAYKRVVRARFAQDTKNLRDELRKAPGPKAYYKLATHYKKMRDYDQAIETARKGVELYPNFEGNYIVLADIRYERFQRDLRAADGLASMELFEKAVDLNRENYRLLFQLAEIYQAVGARSRALEKVRMIMEFAPDDRKALALMDRLKQMKPEKGEDFKEILQDFERRAAAGQVERPGILASRYTRNPEQLARKLPYLAESLEDFKRITVLGPSSELLAGYPGGPEENRRYADSFKKMFDAAVECSLRMEISTFEKGLFDSEDGWTYLMLVDRLRIAVMAGKRSKQDKLLHEIHKFVEHELYI